MSTAKFFNVVLFLSLFVILGAPAAAQFWTATGTMGDSTVNAIAFSPNNNVYAATNKGISRSTDRGATWTSIGPADSMISAVAAPVNGMVLAGTISLYNSMLRTTDDGLHWTRLAVDTLVNINPISAMGVDALGNIIAGGIMIVYRSTDNGDHWSTSYLQTQQAGFNLISVIVPVPSGLVFAAHQSGVYRSSDGGISWERKVTGLDDTTARAIGYDETGYVYAGIYGMGIYRSGDNGDNWQRSDSGVTNHLVSAFASNSLDEVYAGTTGGGVFRTNDNGDHWQEVAGLGNKYVRCLAMSHDGYLYAGTTGGGVYRSQQSTTGLRKLPTGIPGRFDLAQNYPNPFNPSTRISFSLPKERFVKLEVYNLLGARMATLISENLSAGSYSAAWNAASAPSGVYFYRLEAGSFLQTRKMILLR